MPHHVTYAIAFMRRYQELCQHHLHEVLSRTMRLSTLTIITATTILQLFNTPLPTIRAPEMRLLNAHTLELKEFLGDAIPPYVILSHTWDEEEVSLNDMHTGQATSRRGYAKVQGACAQAVRDRYHWIWIDTCCIDKSSSAELQEAINTMFQWYGRANICYAYLADVADRAAGYSARFNESRWWSRGWTLREFAPYPCNVKGQTTDNSPKRGAYCAT